MNLFSGHLRSAFKYSQTFSNGPFSSSSQKVKLFTIGLNHVLHYSVIDCAANFNLFLYPKLLLISNLRNKYRKLFRTSIAYGHIPTAGKHTKVIFILNVGKNNYFETKSLKRSSLTSFLLLGVENLVDTYIRETLMSIFPLSDSQHAYQLDKSTDTAL